MCILGVTVTFKCLHLSSVYLTPVEFPQGQERFNSASSMFCTCNEIPLWTSINSLAFGETCYRIIILTLFAWCHWHNLCCCNRQDLGVNHGSATFLWQLFPVRSLVWARQTLTLGLSNPLVSAKYCMNMSTLILYNDTMSYSHLLFVCTLEDNRWLDGCTICRYTWGESTIVCGHITLESTQMLPQLSRDTNILFYNLGMNL